MTHLHLEVYAVRTLAIFIIMHFVPLLEYKNAWSSSFHLYSCFAQENGSLQTSYIKLFGRLTKISLFCFSPHILTTLFSKSKRRKLRTVFNQIMEWYLKKNNFEASTEGIQVGSRTKYEVIFWLGFEDRPVNLLCRYSVSATPDYMLLEGTVS